MVAPPREGFGAEMEAENAEGQIKANLLFFQQCLKCWIKLVYYAESANVFTGMLSLFTQNR